MAFQQEAKMHLALEWSVYMHKPTKIGCTKDIAILYTVYDKNSDMITLIVLQYPYLKCLINAHLKTKQVAD